MYWVAVCGGNKLMNAASARRPLFREKWRMAFPVGQVIFLLLLLGLGGALILATMEKAAFNTVILLGFVSICGLMLCRITQIRLNDPALKILGYLWLIKLGITLFLLYVGWMPQLDPSSALWGYDPQRYYIQAQELIDNNWSPDFLNLNYVGILYYYGAIYYILGHNPVIPALINAFVTLIASLYLIQVGYEIKSQRKSRDWTLAFVLLLPELLWYDVMTSREMLMAAILLLALLTTGRYLARTAAISFSKVVVVDCLSMFAIAAVRTSMLLPMVASIGLMAVLVNPRNDSRLAPKTILVVCAIVALMAMPVIAGYLGGYNFDFGSAIEIAASASKNIASSADMEWSQNSIGMLLMPEGVLQSLLFVLPRLVLYLVSPLPNIFVSGSDLLAGSWVAWEKLFVLFSSVINILIIPYALAGFVDSLKKRKLNASPLVFHISYWITFLAIAGGNLIIHERYRVMASSLLYGCAWLGARTCSKNLIARATLFWYGLLTLGATFYIVYKFIFS